MFDYLSHGTWQEGYGKWLVGALWLHDMPVLDVGCAAGSISCGIAKAGALVSGCDIAAHLIAQGREHWLKDTLKVCNAADLHHWGDDTFECVHANQVFEWFVPEAVPRILRELLRVTRPGGHLFSVLHTSDRCRDVDPNRAIRPMAWWHDQVASAGWKLRPELLDRVKTFPDSYFQHHDWEAFVAEKPPEEYNPMLIPGEFAVISAQDAEKLLKVLARAAGGEISDTYTAFAAEGATDLLDAFRDLIKHQQHMDHLRYLHRTHDES